MEFSPAKIFLSEQRSQVGDSKYTAHCTFNEYKETFGNLYLFNDEVLAASAEVKMTTAFPAFVVLIPVTGELLYKGKDGAVCDLDVGQVLISRKGAGEHFHVMNMYDDETIHFLHIQIMDPVIDGPAFTILTHFDPEKFRNRFVSAIDGLAEEIPFCISIGQFGGREKAMFRSSDLRSGLFSFVISGAFELEDRLLQPRDGLALWDIDQVELEALSNDATLLIVEVKNYR